jgi:5-hydroxyisourate hydrolase/2-oxo-4-hydroxy-4-carboxy-5-ureidoimidazoline decarboxylase
VSSTPGARIASPAERDPNSEMATTRGQLPVEDVLRVNGSRRFAAALAAASPFASLADALLAARRIWLNEVDVNGWLEAFAAHPAIGTTSSSAPKWCKEEQSAALATATDSTAQELADWNARYREKFGFVFMICASGRTAPEVLAELKVWICSSIT